MSKPNRNRRYAVSVARAHVLHARREAQMRDDARMAELDAAPRCAVCGGQGELYVFNDNLR